MAFAVLSTAFSAYEATRWSGVQATAFTEAGGARTESVAELSIANAQIAYDASTFTAFVLEFRGDALTNEDTREEALRLADRVIRAEFRPAVDAWLAAQLANDPNAPRTPVEMDVYSNARLEEALRLQAVADDKLEEGKDANQIGDSYVLASVFFASVLFFAGITSNIETLNVRWVVLFLGIVALLIGVGRVVTLPFE